MKCPHCKEVIGHVVVEAVPLDSKGGWPVVRQSFAVDAKGNFTTDGSPDNVWYHWHAECPKCDEILDDYSPT